jgi:hypothetical protein
MSSHSRVGICHEASFCADNTLITIVPNFHYSSSLPLLSSPDMRHAPAFVAGMPCEVPLWMARTLHQRRLGQIQIPEWLQASRLSDILRQEKTSQLLTQQLPFYYSEIAQAMPGLEKSTQILLQDLAAVRVDKIRTHFHEMSRNDLQQAQELPMIAVTGIASIELTMIGPFLQRAFSDYGCLTQQPEEEASKAAASAALDKENTATGTAAGSSTGSSKQGIVDDKLGGAGSGSSNEPSTVEKRSSMLRSRLRRFRS